MEIFSMVLSLLSGVALFLFGMSLMGDGLKQVAGNKLEAFLYKMTNTPLKGVALGTGVTSVIQSSSATTVMVIGFVNSGMMKLKQASCASSTVISRCSRLLIAVIRFSAPSSSRILDLILVAIY